MSESTRIKNQALEEARAAAAELRSDERGLGNTPPLQQAYQEALQATEPLEPQTPQAPSLRTTSFAKSLDDQQQQPANDTSQTQQGRGSEMVEKDRPEPQPANKSREAEAVNRSQFNQDWAAEGAKANAHLEEAKAAAAEVRDQEAEAAQERGPERGMGMD